MNQYQTITTTEYFCNVEVERGMCVEYVQNLKLEKQEIYEVKPGQNGGRLIGISLNDLIKIDLYNYTLFQPYSYIDYIKQVGSKIEILQEGIVILDFKKKKQINTLLFYNKKGNLTNKPQLNQKPTGVILDSDDDGFTKVLFRAWGI